MTAQAIPRLRLRRKSRSPALALVALVAVVAVAGALILYLLWPSWPKVPLARDVPALPITVAGVLFNVPPEAIRAPVQRQPGAHERVDLVFLWPSLTPPPLAGDATPAPPMVDAGDGLPAPSADDRLFVTIAPLGPVLSPAERLHTIYPRYFATQATARPDGLAVLPFRPGTPYEGEDLIYFAEKPEQFFALCTQTVRSVPGTCICERSADAAEITLRFPREWLQDWRSVAAGFDQLIAQLHARGG